MTITFTPEEQQVIDTALAIYRSKLRVHEWDCFISPQLVVPYLQLKMVNCDRKTFGVLFLDAKLRLINDMDIFKGTLDSVSVYPREIVKAALKENCHSVLFYQKNPSGHPKPSQSDKTITRKLSDALEMMHINMIDHIIVGDDDYYSFKGTHYKDQYQ
ncbi:JAB domain-containing protein [Vibrio anguillarum]|uniref:MPN domain-containing protein n=1 Tax=Vibrio anguillarum TaxID=55601 RepID=A0A7U6FS29_VIBAN|nr:JAB domain-containing protein [Vibrio anguillarum]AZS26289.1 hypothetical protein DYL72_15380 [Vibrio anguillarum]MBF4374570.1 hypothetical protein [Vibrio anguillarum]MBF4437835.1 hypothetical protein [Vibrio anguillarum]